MANIINQEYIHRSSQREPHILILIMMCSFASMGAIIFTPALPEIGAYFHISDGYSQLTISLFLLGYAIGQLIYGPLANRFGRKPAFFIGVFIATLGSTFNILSDTFQSFELLLLGRALQALGSSAGLILSFTIINDHYVPEQSRRVVAYLMLSFAIVPGIATMIGGMLVSHFHWVSCCYFLLLYGLLLGFAVSLLEETAPILNKQALHFNQIKSGYDMAFKDTLLRNVTFFMGLSGMCVYIYAATVPFIAIYYLEMSPEVYGLFGLIPYIGTALGSITSAKLSSMVPATSFMKIGLVINISITMIIAISFYVGFITLWLLILCGFCFMFGNCLIMGNGASIATSKVENKANASSAMNFINVAMPMCGTFILALIPGSPIVKLPASFLIAMILMIHLWFYLRSVE